MKYATIFLLLLVWVIGGFTQSYIVFFGDSPDPTFYDYSWGYRNAPSELELVGLGSDKFPTVIIEIKT